MSTHGLSFGRSPHPGKDGIRTTSNRRFATYTNLESGVYTFRVKASNNDGLWNETGVSVKIIILPAWWEAWWLRDVTLILIVGLAVVLGTVRHYGGAIAVAGEPGRGSRFRVFWPLAEPDAQTVREVIGTAPHKEENDAM